MNSTIVQITLKKQEVHQLLKLEELFHSHYLTQELLNQMVSLYVKFVQNVPYNQHPLRVFFMQKIKFVLSRTQVIRILQKQQNPNIQNIRNTIRQMHNSVQFQELEIKRMAQQTKAQIRQNHKINMKKDRGNQDSNLKQKQRNMKIEIQMKIMQEMQNNMKQIVKDISNNDKKLQKNNAKINNMVNMQDQTLNQRLANRKKKLRKNSANLNQKEVVVVQTAKPIPKQQLKAVQKQLNQTYQRFTRLTMSRQNTSNPNQKENKGRVKMNVHNQQEQQQLQIQFKKPQTKKQQPAINFSKKKTQPQQEPQTQKPKEQPKRGTQTTTIEYKTFDQANKGRVTKNFKLYQQIQQQETF